MVKKLLILLTTISINAADLRNYHEAMQQLEFQNKFELVGTYAPSIHNRDVLKAKYDLEFRSGLGQNEQYIAFVDSEYNVVVYKKKKTLKRQDAFTEKEDEKINSKI